MASTMERTIIHYSQTKLTKLGSFTISQAKIQGFYGKPMGFWYAYGEDWKHLVNSGKAGRDRGTTYRYIFTLPESTFITNVADVTLDKILELSKSNLDAFMKKYAKDKYRHRRSKDEALKMAFELLIRDGGSAVLNELIEDDEDFGVFCEELMDEDNPNLTKIIKKVKNEFPHIISKFKPSDKALASDHVSPYFWAQFWEDVSKTLGGIEFHTDLFNIDTWNDIYLPWTGTLGIRSGVMFHPDTFSNGVIMEQFQATVFGGNKRRTLRKRGLRRTKRAHRRV
jgi:hypothetical protein